MQWERCHWFCHIPPLCPLTPISSRYLHYSVHNAFFSLIIPAIQMLTINTLIQAVISEWSTVSQERRGHIRKHVWHRKRLPHLRRQSRDLLSHCRKEEDNLLSPLILSGFTDFALWGNTGAVIYISFCFCCHDSCTVDLNKTRKFKPQLAARSC